MFRSLRRLVCPNPLDLICRRARLRGHTRFLLGWNRGLGDIPLGLYAIISRIREWIPDAKIHFLIRKELAEGFSLLKGIEVLIAPDWERGVRYNLKKTLERIGRNPSEFDRIISWPSPTDWVAWQRGALVPRLHWDPKWDELSLRFGLSSEFRYIGVQLAVETNYAPWRSWPHWDAFFEKMAKWPHMKVIVFGQKKSKLPVNSQIVDLRGKTTLLELLSIIKNQCDVLIAPDSGILSMSYYLDTAFPLRVISLWAERGQGILKQNVASPNPLLVHRPLMGANRNLEGVEIETLLQQVFGNAYAG